MPRAAALAALALAACAADDLGAPCRLLRADGTERAAVAGLDVLQSGSGECQRFACVSFGGRPAACTRPCDRAGDACGRGWSCRATILDPSSLATLRARTEGRDEDRDGVDDFEQLVAGLSDALYCAPP